MTTAIRDDITQLDDAELRKELAFARGFGAFDELSGDWLEELEAEAKQRGLED